MKKIVSILLMVFLAFSVCPGSFASDNTPGPDEPAYPEQACTGHQALFVSQVNGDCLPSDSAYCPLISADNPFFRYVGRFDLTDPRRPRVWAPGAYILARFRGDHCKIVACDESNSPDFNFLEIVIDATQHLRIPIKEEYTVIDISPWLKNAVEHSLLICKSTESLMGYIEFLGLQLKETDALLEPDPLPFRKIEFIGNSITCGSGIDLSLSGGVCGNTWFDNHNAYSGYGPQTARNLNAQWHLSSVSGIGLIHSCCNMKYEMPDIYTKLSLQPFGPEWDFDRYIPDLVTICLGQNDGIQDSSAFCTAYVDLIENLRNKYPEAYIICLNSPMADDALTVVLRKYIASIVDYMNNQGDKKVLKCTLSHNFNEGCTSHPDQSQHDIIAEELTEFIQSTLEW